MSKRKGRSLAKNQAADAHQTQSPRNEFCRFSPLKEDAETARRAERKVRHIFNSMIGTLRSICDRQMYLPKASRRVSALYTKYIELCDEFLVKGSTPSLPTISAEKRTTLQNYALHEKPFSVFIDYYRSHHLSPDCDTCPDELKTIAKVYYEIQEISRVVHRFNEVFSDSEPHRVPHGSNEYNALRIWIDWLLDAYPSSRNEPDAVTKSISLAHDMVRQKPQQPYADARKEGLRILLNRVRRMTLKVEELQSIQEDVKQLDDALISLCKMLDRDTADQFNELQRSLKEKSLFYASGTSSTDEIPGILKNIEDSLLGLWPKD
ncbi:Uncharacterised protein [uncultured archaeon]|nr:Uncharacterised protein [uncultured archaeon]